MQIPDIHLEMEIVAVCKGETGNEVQIDYTERDSHGVFSKGDKDMTKKGRKQLRHTK